MDGIRISFPHPRAHPELTSPRSCTAFSVPSHFPFSCTLISAVTHQTLPRLVSSVCPLPYVLATLWIPDIDLRKKMDVHLFLWSSENKSFISPVMLNIQCVFVMKRICPLIQGYSMWETAFHSSSDTKTLQNCPLLILILFFSFFQSSNGLEQSEQHCTKFAP